MGLNLLTDLHNSWGNKFCNRLRPSFCAASYVGSCC